MALTAKVGGEVKVVQDGLHPSVCVSVVDLGRQHSEKFGTDPHQVMITWELTDEEREFEGESYCAKTSKTYTLSMNPKANLRKLVEGWRGKKMTDEEAEAFDLFALLGKPCMVQTTSAQGANGKTYTNVVAVVSVPKGVIVPASKAPLVKYEMGQPLPPALPEWLVIKITSSPDYMVQDGASASATTEEAPW